MKLQYYKPIASITVDCVIFGFNEDKLKILAIKRSSKPESGKWALPGGFMEKGESLEQAADRVLEMLTGVEGIYMEQIQAFSNVKRHPEGRVVTIGFFALINPENFELKPSKHASEAEWFELDDMPTLAFDHEDIFDAGLSMLRREIKLRPIGFELLPTKFTLTDLQKLYEAIIEGDLDRRNFRRKIKAMGFLKELKEKRKGAHVGATLYKFDARKYKKLVKDGFSFSI